MWTGTRVGGDRRRRSRGPSSIVIRQQPRNRGEKTRVAMSGGRERAQTAAAVDMLGVIPVAVAGGLRGRDRRDPALC